MAGGEKGRITLSSLLLAAPDRRRGGGRGGGRGGRQDQDTCGRERVGGEGPGETKWTKEHLRSMDEGGKEAGMQERRGG